jgi:hypothetical protein
MLHMIDSAVAGRVPGERAEVVPHTLQRGRVERAPSGVALLCELSLDVQPVLFALVLQLRCLQVGVCGRADGAVKNPRRDEG